MPIAQKKREKRRKKKKKKKDRKDTGDSQQVARKPGLKLLL
jgi:hypothetical protein